MYRTRFSLADLIASLAIAVVLVFFSLAATSNLDSRDARVKCAMNLRQIGQALLLYSNDARGPFPRTVYDPNRADWPTAYTAADFNNFPFVPGGPTPNDVSAGLYLLMRTEDITSQVFVCPATGAKAYDFGGQGHNALEHCNFPDSKSLGYSYANPYASPAAVGRGYKLVQGLEPTFAVAADMNPGAAVLTQLSINSDSTKMRDGNSANHSGDGQNVLFGDGHVEFQNNPFCGMHRDNIYTFGDSGEDPNTHAALPTGGLGVWGSPVGPADSVLLPAVIVPTTSPPAVAASLSAAPAPAALAPTAPTADSPANTLPPASAVPLAPMEEATDMTPFVLVSSLALLVALLIVVAIVVLKRRSRNAQQGGQH
jgi:prepilin-type processing-associated H-X9-DG protein